MLLALCLLPPLLGLAAFFHRDEQRRVWLLPLGAGVHLLLSILALAFGATDQLNGWLVLDPLGKLVLMMGSLLFFLCSFYAPGYLRQVPHLPNRVFIACLLAFLGAMTLIILAHHLGLMWV